LEEAPVVKNDVEKEKQCSAICDAIIHSGFLLSPPSQLDIQPVSHAAVNLIQVSDIMMQQFQLAQYRCDKTAILSDFLSSFYRIPSSWI
jgi:hypothetical protein